MAYNYLKKIAYFYPRPPRGGRLDSDFRSLWDKLFLSTPSARRATGLGLVEEQLRGISIHALREEGDCWLGSVQNQGTYFYPRPPRGGRRLVFYRGQRNRIISIHALREEGDQRVINVTADQNNFYPRPPRGGRHAQALKACRTSTYFYPRPPRGGRPKFATKSIRIPKISIHALREEGDATRPAMPLHLQISIHALREEGDSAWPVLYPGQSDFYPRPPRGGRQYQYSTAPSRDIISIHALREEGDVNTCHSSQNGPNISIHALREEGDPECP